MTFQFGSSAHRLHIVLHTTFFTQPASSPSTTKLAPESSEDLSHLPAITSVIVGLVLLQTCLQRNCHRNQPTICPIYQRSHQSSSAWCEARLLLLRSAKRFLDPAYIKGPSACEIFNLAAVRIDFTSSYTLRSLRRSMSRLIQQPFLDEANHLVMGAKTELKQH
nr:uncharacterized protein LOC129385199 [Dermacentor andersoni]